MQRVFLLPIVSLALDSNLLFATYKLVGNFSYLHIFGRNSFMLITHGTNCF